MSTPEPNAYSRRLFLQQGVTLASIASTVPWFIQQSAAGVMHPLDSAVSSLAGVPEDRVLVVVQLGGGNDGLNTVIPYFSDGYRRARPSLAVGAPGSPNGGAGEALQLDQDAGLGLHPQLGGLKQLHDEGLLSVVQGTGYPNPNRSHFTSMDIWHTARRDAKGNGWIGRYFDNTCNGTPTTEGAISIGRTAPLAMIGDVQKPVSFESEDLFRWLGQDLHGSMKTPYEQINRMGMPADVQPDTQASFLMRTALDAQLSSDRIRAAVTRPTLVNYPNNNPLAAQLRMVGAMIRDEMRTRVYYVTLGGFDTHAGQLGSHGNKMRQFGEAMRLFQQDLRAQGNDSRVLTMVFSEFGRRVAQNASGGTDHGTAAPMFLVGPMVRAGVLGQHPSLDDLDSGDLKHTVDFRSVYASVLEDWMKTPATDVLGQAFPKANVFNPKALI